MDSDIVGILYSKIDSRFNMIVLKYRCYYIFVMFNLFDRLIDNNFFGSYASSNLIDSRDLANLKSTAWRL
jgi:hypothetical protein